MSNTDKVQTDNSHFTKKIKLRLLSLESINKKNVSILDCYSGQGRIWKAIKRLSDKNINTTRMDIKKDRNGIYMCGDNTKFLETIKLNNYDVIDLDAYGVPYEQLHILERRKYSGAIHITYIQSVMGNLPHAMLERIGIKKDMLNQAQTLYAEFGHIPILHVLASMGYKYITGYFISRKAYFYVDKMDI